VIAADVFADGYNTAALWQGGTSWKPLPALSESCFGFKSSATGVSSGGASVVGNAVLGECELFPPFRWDKATDTATELPVPADTWFAQANGISGDGSVVWGARTGSLFDGTELGMVWIDGQPVDLSTPDYPVGAVRNGNANGSILVGGGAGSDAKAWRWTANGGLETIGHIVGGPYATSTALSDDGRVVVGWALSPSYVQRGFIWTRGLGIMSIEQFLASQGIVVDSRTFLLQPAAMSADGRRIAGAGILSGVPVGWYFDMPKVKVCHIPSGNSPKARTIEVAFPEGLDDHLSHGDTLGACQAGSRP
jgi:uncharacterized membrane protein